MSTHRWEAKSLQRTLERSAASLSRDEPIDLIHAHFVYPEGVAAAALGRRLNVPVMTTEHANWLPWLDRYPAVRKQVLASLSDITLVSAVSEATLSTARRVGGDHLRGTVIPNVLDTETFRPSLTDRRVAGRLLFVGAVRKVKGLDLLVKALPGVIRRHPQTHLHVLGEPFRRTYRKEAERVQSLVRQLKLEDRVHFLGGADPAGVATAMRRAALVVIPSRRESFSVVAIEALATGTPVVATRCGGPEEILGESGELGVLVDPEDADALADAVTSVLADPGRFDPNRLYESVATRYSPDRVGSLLEAAYLETLGSGR